MKVIIGDDFFSVNYKTTDKEKKEFNLYTENGQIFYKVFFDQLKDININSNKNNYSIDVITINNIKFNFTLNFFDKKVRIKIINEFKEIQNNLIKNNISNIE